MRIFSAISLSDKIDYVCYRQLNREQDWFNRIWKAKKMSEYLNIVSAIIVDDTMLGENYPPWPVMQTAIQAKNISDSIHLSVNFSAQTTTVAYFVLYFRDPIGRFTESIAQVEIFLDSQKLGATDVPPDYRTTDVFHVVSFYPVQVNGSANVTISPAKNSTLAPLLNAMEVFSVVNMPYASKAAYLPNLSVVSCLVFLHLLIIIVSATELF